MKLIEGLKKIKDLEKKKDDLRERIAKHSAYLSCETAVYPDQKGQVNKWLQEYSDILKEILKIRVCIQKTNLETEVDIELGGKVVKKSISEWIHRRRDLAEKECKAWKALTDRGLREGKLEQSTGEVIEVKIVRCYDPKKRDERVDLLQSEPSIIDGRLEVVNAVTDIKGI